MEIEGGFALQYINILFSPSFVFLPLSSPIAGIEIAKIIGVLGWFHSFLLFVTLLIQKQSLVALP